MTSPGAGILPALAAPFITDGSALQSTQLIPDPTAAIMERVGAASTVTTGTTLVATLTGAVAVGESVMAFLGWSSSGAQLGSITDSKGNTYRIGAQILRGGTSGSAVAMAMVTTALAIGDTVTFNFTGGNATQRGVTLYHAHGLADAPPVDAGAASGTATNTTQVFTLDTSASATTCLVQEVVHDQKTLAAGGAIEWLPTDTALTVVNDPCGGERLYTIIKPTPSVGGLQQLGGVATASSGQKAISAAAWPVRLVQADLSNPNAHDDSVGLYGTTWADQLGGLSLLNYYALQDNAGQNFAVDSIGGKTATLSQQNAHAFFAQPSIMPWLTRSASMDGFNASPAIVMPSTITNPPQFTIFGWWYFDTMFQYRTVYSCRDAVALTQGFHLEPSTNAVGWGATIADSNAAPGSYLSLNSPAGDVTAPATGVLTFIALTFDGVRFSINVNGREAAGVNVPSSFAYRPATPSVSPLHIGNGHVGRFAGLGYGSRGLQPDELEYTYRRGLKYT